jgi:hypothetical protein
MTDNNRTSMILTALAAQGTVCITRDTDGVTVLEQRRFHSSVSTIYRLVELGRGADVESAAEVAAERWLGQQPER